MIVMPYTITERVKRVSIHMANIIRQADAETAASTRRARLAQRKERAAGLMVIYDQSLTLDCWDALFLRLHKDDSLLYQELFPHTDAYRRAYWLAARGPVCNGE